MTLGQLAVMEPACPAGLSVHAHIHAGEDEMLYLLDGELAGFCDHEERTAHPGSFVFETSRATAAFALSRAAAIRSSCPRRRPPPGPASRCRPGR